MLALSNCMVIGDRRKYLAMVVTLKTEMDVETGASTDRLSADSLFVGKQVRSVSVFLYFSLLSIVWHVCVRHTELHTLYLTVNCTAPHTSPLRLGPLQPHCLRPPKILSGSNTSMMAWRQPTRRPLQTLRSCRNGSFYPLTSRRGEGSWHPLWSSREALLPRSIPSSSRNYMPRMSAKLTVLWCLSCGVSGEARTIICG